ncbi:Glycosyltransferase [Actinidia chinensis var. chinensis]|uniref:Glycosyltransferase n=1 Tax=Actinidia chinensis var. chinensis TaxID=1590841 RepID=A0A2R6Q2V3_ACTCC|nr:Glycosyltransferase [Actinidia chinensis var. chinensis]
MGHEVRYLCQVEARRLVLLIGMVVAVVLVMRYIELPYGSVTTSIFSTVRPHVSGIGTFPTGDSFPNPEVLDNRTSSNHLKSTDTYERGGLGLENGFVSEKNGSSDDSLELDADSDPEDESPSGDIVEANHNSTVDIAITDNGLAPEKDRESAYSNSPNNAAASNNSSLGSSQEESNTFTAEKNGSIAATPSTSLLALPPITSSPNLNTSTNTDKNSLSPMISIYPNTSSVAKDIGKTFPKDDKSEELQSDTVPSENSSSKTNVPAVKEKSKKISAAVVSISEMNDLLLESRASSFSMRPRWPSPVDQELLNAKLQIANVPIIENDRELDASLFRNVSMFKRSYELMEQMLKVYIYKEGERPIFHQPILKGIYASEGWFMKQLKANKKIVTKKPRKAHLFFLPFSSRMLEETLYVPNSHNHKNLVKHLKDYLDMIAARYSFWNRTGGSDHFLVACHDWAPSETNKHMANCIRALCNSDIKDGFIFGKDVSLPETYVRSAQNPLRELGGKPPSQRRILAFFAGNMHGYLRPILLQHWENKDPDMKIFGRMRKVKGQMNYVQHMKNSKYCVCAKGYEVNSPRVVEAIFYECVPVIISDDFVPPFFEILNWVSFAVFVPEKDIPNLKDILLSIPKKRYLEMQRRVKKVQQHFLWNARPVKYDIFHMILHSIWYNRVFRIRT